MSVSDPLLKKFKGIILELRSGRSPVTDDNEQLQPLCLTLEQIFSKGFKVSNNSWLKKCTYWTWISKLPTLSSKDRISPMCSMAIEAIKKSKKTQTDTGRGRCFIRQALVKKFLVAPVQLLARLEEFTAIWYNENDSILGNEILREILLSLLLSLKELDFDLELKNASFLDLTWEIPTFRHYEFVPCDDLGLHLRTVKGYPVVVEVDRGSVAGEDNKIEVGDVLDEMCGQCLRGKGKMTMQNILEDYQGLPIHICVLKSYDKDGYQFAPIKRLLDKSNIPDLSPTSPKSDSLFDWEDKPRPEAILPEDVCDEVPVHDSEGRATYNTVYLGKALLGKHGGVNMIEVGVAEVLSRSSNIQDVRLDLGEKDITVTCKHSKKTILHHLYTEVSACGRRTDKLLNYAFIAGETYCGLAQEFYCHVFQATSDEEAKVILCTVAQGFERTHLMT